ncbi:hypothetical protein [Escherichia coli]
MLLKIVLTSRFNLAKVGNPLIRSPSSIRKFTVFIPAVARSRCCTVTGSS